jgi:hypothetical protein
MSKEFSTTAIANRKAQANAIPSTMPSVVILLAEIRGATVGDEAFSKRATSFSILSGSGASDIG